MSAPHALIRHAAFAGLSALVFGIANAMAASLPARVTFASADGRTTLVGYVFLPEGPHAARVPAVVMMHGRAGAYSSLANGKYDASTLSKRHQQWGQIWAQQGYLAVLVDGFGPRGYPHGFPRFSYDSRPDELNEVTVRPLDAYGALAYLRTPWRRACRPDCVAGLVQWRQRDARHDVGDRTRHRRANACHRLPGRIGVLSGLRPEGSVHRRFKPYAPVRVFHGSADEEVSPKRCADLVAKSQAIGGDIQFQLYSGATHGFDDPKPSRQDEMANASATRDATTRAIAFLQAC